MIQSIWYYWRQPAYKSGGTKADIHWLVPSQLSPVRRSWWCTLDPWYGQRNSNLQQSSWPTSTHAPTLNGAIESLHWYTTSSYPQQLLPSVTTQHDSTRWPMTMSFGWSACAMKIDCISTVRSCTARVPLHLLGSSHWDGPQGTCLIPNTRMWCVWVLGPDVVQCCACWW